MAIKYINMFHSKAFQNIPKLWLLFRKHTIWQPCFKPEIAPKPLFRRRCRHSSASTDRTDASGPALPQSQRPGVQCFEFRNSRSQSNGFELQRQRCKKLQRHG
jgi:hypothetical protein